MFTGLIEKKQLVVSANVSESGGRLTIENTWPDIQAGESIAINGVCLTVRDGFEDTLSFDISAETVARTHFLDLCAGDEVNVERAMLVSERMGGHYVSGHVDCTARVVDIQAANDYINLQIANFQHESAGLYLLEKGSITVEGVSLTINAVDYQRNCISLMLVPHTLKLTNLGALDISSPVNIEFDYLTRIVAHQMQQTGQLLKEVKS